MHALIFREPEYPLKISLGIHEFPGAVGSAVSLAQAGATVVDMQVAGRWKSSQMPAHYAKAELAERGA